jgi:hypothetical protein
MTRPTLLLLSTTALFILAASTGCNHDRPRDYASRRPAPDQLDPRDRGLQSKDVVNASDALATDLLASPELNTSRTQWTLVVDKIENRTSNPTFNYDIFIRRLRTELFQKGRGRITLIENRDAFYGRRNQELDYERGGDPYGQGGARPAPPPPQPTQPDYVLYGRFTDLPNRGTDYYYCEFTVTDFHTRQIVWTNAYEVRVAR